MLHKTDNDGVHIAHILATTTCKKHSAIEGVPCWEIYIPSKKKYTNAVCGRRIKRAGFVGKISPTSLSMKSSGRRR